MCIPKARMKLTYFGISIIVKNVSNESVKGIPIRINNISSESPEKAENEANAEQWIQLGCVHVKVDGCLTVEEKRF